MHERFEALQQPNEAVTEQDLIRPVMELLGWSDYLPQQAAAGHEDVPDHLLFADAAAKARATGRGNSDERFQDALIVQESKRFGLALDQRDRTDEHRAGTPHVFHDVEVTTADLRGLLDCLCGLQWMTAGMKRTARSRYEIPLAEALSHNPTDAYRILAHGPDSIRPGTADAESDRLATIRERWQEARTIARQEEFLYGEAAFPGVWQDWQSLRPDGGFDAVIGNPPWDRIKLQEVEWFATRAAQIALAPTAAARRAAIRRLRALRPCVRR